MHVTWLQITKCVSLISSIAMHQGSLSRLGALFCKGLQLGAFAMASLVLFEPGQEQGTDGQEQGTDGQEQGTDGQEQGTDGAAAQWLSGGGLLRV
jgi:hypothetical protein